MIDKLDTKYGSSILIHTLAPALCLFAPFVNFLSVNGYLLPRLEILIIFSACLVVGLLSGILKALGLSKSALIPLGAAASFSTAFLTNIDTTTLAVAIVTGLSVVIWILRAHAATILLVAASVHIASSALLRLPDDGRENPVDQNITDDMAITGINENLPPILHIVFDEFTGIHGLPKEVAGASQLADSLVDYYRNQQFVVYTHAYSEYDSSINSLNNLVNFRFDPEDLGAGRTSFTVKTNAYFRHLSNLGYRLNVFQSDFIDYCQIQGVTYVSCHTYKSDTAASLDPTDLGSVDKATFLLNSFLTTSEFTINVRFTYERMRKRFGFLDLPAWQPFNRRVGPLAIIPSVQELNRALSRMRPANVYFAHLLAPHFPYVWRADCSIRPNSIHWLHISPWDDKNNTSEGRTKRYQQYFEQVGCLQKKVDGIFDTIRQAGMWDKSIIIIHSDHGSRIAKHRTDVPNLETLTPEDYRDTYSAFFAHKKAMPTNGDVETKPASLRSLLASIFLIPNIPAEDKIVYLGRSGVVPNQKSVAHKLLGFSE